MNAVFFALSVWDSRVFMQHSCPMLQSERDPTKRRRVRSASGASNIAPYSLPEVPRSVTDGDPGTDLSAWHLLADDSHPSWDLICIEAVVNCGGLKAGPRKVPVVVRDHYLAGGRPPCQFFASRSCRCSLDGCGCLFLSQVRCISLPSTSND